MNGFEDDGSLRPPTTSTLRPWFDRKAKPVAVLENEMMWEDRPFDAMLLMIETALKVEKIMAFLVETGLSPKDINYYMPTVEDKADASRRARMRRIISNFIARSIKGAYPEVSTYTYFRDQDDVRDYGASCLRLPAVGVYYMIRKRYRNLDVAIVAAQCGVRLPKVLQVDYAWAKAMADNARGKTVSPEDGPQFQLRILGLLQEVLPEKCKVRLSAGKRITLSLAKKEWGGRT
eukprot:s690_g2.t1